MTSVAVVEGPVRARRKAANPAFAGAIHLSGPRPQRALAHQTMTLGLAPKSLLLPAGAGFLGYLLWGIPGAVAGALLGFFIGRK